MVGLARFFLFVHCAISAGSSRRRSVATLILSDGSLPEVVSATETLDWTIAEPADAEAALLTVGARVAPAHVPSVGWGERPWVAAAVGCAIVLLAVVAALYTPGQKRSGPAQRPLAEGASQMAPPVVLQVFTACVCFGAMANVTVVLPGAAESARSLGYGMVFSGIIIGCYPVGALVGLFYFGRLPVEKTRDAYLVQAVTMLLANISFVLGLVFNSAWLLIAARAVLGFEGGSMYNSALAMVHFARPETQTGYLVKYQLFVVVGVLGGPLLSGLGILAGGAHGMSEALSGVVANAVLAAFGLVVLIGLLTVFPKTWSEMEELAGGTGPTTGSPANQVVAQTGATSSSAAPKAGVAIAFAILASSYLRMAQRLMLESGGIVLVAEGFGWGSGLAGVAFGVIGVFKASALASFAIWFSTRMSDASWLWVLQAAQVAGIFMMIAPGHTLTPGFEVQFSVGAIIAYCANGVWGGVITSWCLKQAQPGTIFSRENLLIVSQIGIFTGIGVGGVISRAILSRDVSEVLLSYGMMLIAFLQIFLVWLVEPPVLTSRVVVPIIVTTAAGVYAVMSKSLGGSGVDNVFTYHIVFMMLAWFACAPSGLLAQLSSDGGEQVDRSAAHAKWMGAAGFCAALGYYFIFRAHNANGKSHFGNGDIWHTLHVVLGYAALVGCAVQVGTGFMKRFGDSEKLKFHGQAGRALAAIAHCAAGVGLWLQFAPDGGWSMPLRMTLTAGLAIVATIGLRARPQEILGEGCS